MATYYLDEDENSDSDADSDGESILGGEDGADVDGGERAAVVRVGGHDMEAPLVSPITTRLDGHIIKSRGTSRSRSRSRSRLKSRSRSREHGAQTIDLSSGGGSGSGISPLIETFPIQGSEGQGDEGERRSGVLTLALDLDVGVGLDMGEDFGRSFLGR